MAADWYIEALPGDTWRKVSVRFREWLQTNAALRSFGYSEGDPLEHGSLRLLCFSIPSHHGESINLFGAWAQTTGRVYGLAEDGIVALSTGERITLLPPPSQEIPPWLRNP